MLPTIRVIAVAFLFVFLIVSPALAVYCSQCGSQESDSAHYCSQCGAPLAATQPSGLYKTALEKYQQGQYDAVVADLEPYCNAHPRHTKARVLLAKAYLQKCEILKEDNDRRYKKLVYIPFEMGKRMLTRNRTDPEGLFICAKSFLINHRAIKALRYIKKAIKLTPGNPEAEYYYVWGDAATAVALNERDRAYDTPAEYFSAVKAYRHVIDGVSTDDEKAIGYLKLALLYKRFGNRSKSKAALRDSLDYANQEIIKSRIKTVMGRHF